MMKKKSPVSFPADLTVECNALFKKSDKDIDFSDIPELDFEKLGKPVIGKFYNPIKKAYFFMHANK